MNIGRGQLNQSKVTDQPDGMDGRLTECNALGRFLVGFKELWWVIDVRLRLRDSCFERVRKVKILDRLTEWTADWLSAMHLEVFKRLSKMISKRRLADGLFSFLYFLISSSSDVTWLPFVVNVFKYYCSIYSSASSGPDRNWESVAHVFGGSAISSELISGVRDFKTRWSAGMDQLSVLLCWVFFVKSAQGGDLRFPCTCLSQFSWLRYGGGWIVLFWLRWVDLEHFRSYCGASILVCSLIGKMLISW